MFSWQQREQLVPGLEACLLLAMMGCCYATLSLGCWRVAGIVGSSGRLEGTRLEVADHAQDLAWARTVMWLAIAGDGFSVISGYVTVSRLELGHDFCMAARRHGHAAELAHVRGLWGA